MACPCSDTPSSRRRRSTPASPSPRSAMSRARWIGSASISRTDRGPPDQSRVPRRPGQEPGCRRRLSRPRGGMARGQRRSREPPGHSPGVMSAIETCRTAALGGHVERCEDCAHERIAYNSCLMGKIRNGESIGTDIGFAGFRGLCGPHYGTAWRLGVSGGRKEPSRDATERWPLRLRVCWWDRRAHIFWWLSWWCASTRVIGH